MRSRKGEETEKRSKAVRISNGEALLRGQARPGQASGTHTPGEEDHGPRCQGALIHGTI